MNIPIYTEDILLMSAFVFRRFCRNLMAR